MQPRLIKLLSWPGEIMFAGFIALPFGLVGVQSEAQDFNRSPASTYRVLHTFNSNGAEGSSPRAALVQAPDGNFYGTNFYGGGSGFGTAFKMTPQGKLTVLHTFTGAADGNYPAGLTLGNDGALYGQASLGGQYGGGTAFKLTTKGRFTLLHSFGTNDDGGYPIFGAMVLAKDRNFYGTTSQYGANNVGTAFKMTPKGQVTVLHQFAGGPGDGANPQGQLMQASDGNFYGTTFSGGSNDPFNEGGGTLYRMSPDGTVTVLINFSQGGPGGSEPSAAPTQGSDGLLYGTTVGGGNYGFGTVYKVALNGTSYITLHDFEGGPMGPPKNRDGAWPMAQLVLASDGNLYGTCYFGGPNQRFSVSGDGTLFSISSTGAYASLRAFGANATDGASPEAALTQGTDGFLYGTTWNGGNVVGSEPGALFRFALP